MLYNKVKQFNCTIQTSHLRINIGGILL